MATSRRDSLIDAAANLLDQGGPAAVTLRAVGKAVGVSHNAPYKHFANKEDLLAAVAARDLARSTPSVDAGPFEQLWAAMRLYVRWALRYPERFRLAYGRWSLQSQDVSAAALAARAGWVDLVTQAQAIGRMPAGDPHRVTALMLAAAHGAADLELSGHIAKDGSGAASAEDLVDDFFMQFGRR